MNLRPRPNETSTHLPATIGVLSDRLRQAAIGQSHERCVALGLTETSVPELSPAPFSRLIDSRERHRRLYEQAAPVMEMLFEQIVSTRSIVALTDPQGTILHSVGDSGFLERAQQIALAPGVNWSESTKGTNAIGTALFTETPTIVHADEHYVRANHFLTCSAAPIFDHAGQMLGVLDVSGDHRSYHAHTLAMVTMSARMIENQWFADKFRHGLRLHFHRRPEMLGTMREAMVALSPDGKILGANRSALELLGISAAALRMQGLEAVFGITLAGIVDHCRHGTDEPLKLASVLRHEPDATLYARALFNWPTLWPALATQAPPEAAEPVRSAAAATTLEAQEVEAVRQAVESAGGNISLAARRLGVARNTVYRKLAIATKG
ncbi:MAG TPA: helix-turn-helix domain-containing protein [Burkholderiaceae bacterium]|nr:helix-turn-helix domain-containing protein [Burkholderiaceae bacterium]